MRLGKELRRGLIAIVLLACIGVATFATVASAASHGRMVASRLKQPR
jgi:hypothetical protein